MFRKAFPVICGAAAAAALCLPADQRRPTLMRSMHAFWQKDASSVKEQPEEKQFSPMSPLYRGPAETKPPPPDNAKDVDAKHVCGHMCPGRIADVAGDVVDSVICIRVEMDVAVKTGVLRQEPRVFSSVGSGFCVDAERRLFVTNAHVVSDATAGASVRFPDLRFP
jgi:S1-C subfamily serine protease